MHWNMETRLKEVQKEAFEKKQRVLKVDDLLTTGGTLKAKVDLVESLNSEVVECFVIEWN